MYNIIIGFSKPKNPYKLFSLLIRWYLKTPYSHVFIVIDDTIYHASKKYVHSIPKEELEEYFKKNEILFINKISINLEQKLLLYQSIARMVGKGYSLGQNLGYVIANIFGLNKNPWKGQGFNCSEFVLKVLLHAKLVKRPNKDLNLITPKDVFNILF